ncbi:MAG: C4-dicarboxylate ABC transporter substrate-binding protein [Polynucleobacter sp. 24-46-87]|uniref:TAXI family TRAP transporter solute-binding subunit n=1 Tax=unclassified Polynucleobacter TaxID=2640945 RepID=UPI000BCAA35C|nr:MULTISPECIES: TAXI family TRAP transporter solute-binding subunit [unclassified Polynucleobacter]OYY21704.1 MAG: C4-dicarboxylate ABC transporter substrate-binding protein [Polynucleobacter sp. 35-46-11]OZA16054.1 MAG: C4-dicarboxylate ABC transporter substrate-binding protein [Polynucleobacter sp. 24-46-87]OZA78340.1 MAG: C4-dicarboxylate ABC transporter substrate-binding protein [Polynucleobacter sp. 39-46-10]
MDFIRKNIYNPMAVGIAFLILVAILFATLWVLVPPPPRSIELATGFPTGLYQQFGEKLKSELAEEGISLKLRTTGGTSDNLSLLGDPNSGVDFAMVQGGVADLSKHPNFVSIAGVFYEPVWVWYRESSFPNESGRLGLLSQLKDKRVSIGNEGSGTLSLASQLLEASGLTMGDLRTEKLKPLDALEKFKKGELDAVFLVSAAEAPLVKSFYETPGIRLMSFEQAEAYVHLFPFLSKVTVPRGVVSIGYDLPKQDIQVLAATATLVGKRDVSPALVTLLLGDTYEILKTYSYLQKSGEFPSGTGLDFPLHVDAEIYLKDGPSFLHRYLPFWTAVWIGRFAKIVIPLLVILIPLFTYIPAAKNLLLRLKLSQVYDELKIIEKNASNPALKEKNFKDLEDIERRVGNIRVSMLDAKELYDLKGHVGEVRGRLNLHS